MKNQIWKRLLAMVLAVIMSVAMLPTAAYAALLDKGPDENREILSQLREICGSQEEAERYYDLLQQYNLLDEDGSAVEHWSITMDGEEITLDELRALLEGSYDGQQIVEVDGMPISLSDLAVILEIEDYIAYLRETYYTGHQWTQEQQDSLDSLMDQITNEGLQFEAAESSDRLDLALRHYSEVLITGSYEPDENGKVTCHFYLNKGYPGQVASFDWEALPSVQGISEKTRKGTVEMIVGPDGNAEETIEIQLENVQSTPERPVQFRYGPRWYLKLDNAKNCFFKNQQKDKIVTAISRGHWGRAIGGDLVNPDATEVRIEEITAPAGTYYPGQIVPVTVRFSKSVDVATVRATFAGGETYSPDGALDGMSNYLTFAYEVQDKDSPTLTISSITAEDNAGHSVTEENIEIKGVTLDAPFKTDAIVRISVAYVNDNDPIHPSVYAELQLSNDPALTQWMSSELKQDEKGRFYIPADVLGASIDGGKTKYPLYLNGESVTGSVLTCEIPLVPNFGDRYLLYVADFYLYEDLICRMFKQVAQYPVKFITEDDLSASIAIKAAGTENDYTLQRQSIGRG